MNLYHGTKKEYLDSILKKGLKRGQNNGDSVYIYTTETPEEASKWGDVVLQIESKESDDLRIWPDEKPVWQVMFMNDIKPEQIIIYKDASR